ncbi:endonuclease/exonuclease/phosphatase family protein [Niabella pedocola]|uniref:Endonuclease/exonuclease/phosphatase family protein n=1 Tax=Niabella pedocola TaxID=1752077 RepID=A0ABS8PRK8_9BACT|nr:endonuclease/exonuclease/phosphatase family protein [Niabella pedocola]MCD2423720.1 endonuclease/exonuclease/phosphatase family protein [Niabella pedocola]
MRYVLMIGVFFLFTTATVAQSIGNRVLHLDGTDNNVRTGMPIIKSPWTIEAWIKGNDTSWKETEVLFGGGEYSQLSTTDGLPLVIKNGRLHNPRAGLWSSRVLDDQWHHVALSCDGTTTCLYLDGVMTDRKPVAFAILPGALGVQETAATAFGGLMDEVRIWRTAVPLHTLNEWMYRPLAAAHPGFKALIGYYTFDDDIDDMVVNWVGKGDQAYHLRNGRIQYNGHAPLAYTVANDNPRFFRPEQQQLFNAVVVESEWDADAGTRGDQILKLRIAVTGSAKPLELDELTLSLSKVTALSDIDRIHLYYAGKTPSSKIREELFGNGKRPQRSIRFAGKPYRLTPGIHYFLVTADIAENAGAGHLLKMTVPSFRLNRRLQIPETGMAPISKSITESSNTAPDIVKVLQWNIWHGGVHVGDNGPDRVTRLIQATHADIVTMQEAYGSQQRIADSLGYYLSTPSSRDNLALFSRYPLTGIPTAFKTFNSNPAIIHLPGDRRLLVNACWLRYAYQPEYTSVYQEPGQDTRTWIAADSLLGLADARAVIQKDTKPYQNDTLPAIIGGDFNSCSHLDWTKAAATLHFGYGPIAFPVSRYMLQEGYKDSFREANPNEVVRPEGTWAVIYGHLQHCRIDFLYYKGRNIKTVASRIIKTAPEIDDVWPSDHAAVFTTFRLGAF